ncbi:MAG: YifB family Mg chelatase-like AAA ATPase [Oscillospiraceae bacterium]|nr:YifB family Mg chelatase-like AAA ATPase [Oscillospiraceae bacterium]
MYCCYKSYGVTGIDAYQVQVEVDLARGMPGFEIVGLPDAAVKESRDRVRAAVSSTGYPFPVGKIVINLAPAAVKKTGPIYDVPILLSILSAKGYLPEPAGKQAFLGELSLFGELRPVRGVLSMVLQAREDGIEEIFLPKTNAAEGAAVDGITVYAAGHITDIIGHLNGEKKLVPEEHKLLLEQTETYPLDLRDVKGQPLAKRALEVAAAGGHNLLFIGPPGAGKSMLAKRIPTILPPLTEKEIIETAKIHSVAGLLGQKGVLSVQRPFRSPHHTVSPAGLSGGGSNPMPGEVSLAHNGVLFLDELPEFSRQAIEILRQPIEDGAVTISRASSRVTYPCNVMVVAAMNPCPCGYLGHPTIACRCSEKTVDKYLSKVSGPLLDRMDIQVEVAPLEYADLTAQTEEECSAQVRERICKARAIQEERFCGTATTCNAGMTPAQMREFCQLTEDASKRMAAAFDRMGLSGRAYDRILKVSRTIADLSGSRQIESKHLMEALQYRSLDRQYWRR